jgi:hypothetical protein
VTHLVECSTIGRAMRPPSHDTAGGAETRDTADETTGLKVDEASLAAVMAPTSPASRSLAPSTSTVSNASKREVEEAGHSTTAPTIGSQGRSPSFPLDPFEEWRPTSSVPSTALATVASSTFFPWRRTLPPTKEGSAGAVTRSSNHLPWWCRGTLDLASVVGMDADASGRHSHPKRLLNN